MSSKVARWLAMLLPFFHVMHAQVVPLKESVSTGNVQCDQNWLSSTSATLASPRGDAASLALRGQILRGKSSDDNRCLTTWSLNINTADSVETIVVGKRDDEWYCEHLFEMNGWSKDGKLLLMSMITDAGDWDETIPIVFDVRTRQVHRIELAPLFSKVTARS